MRCRNQLADLTYTLLRSAVLRARVRNSDRIGFLRRGRFHLFPTAVNNKAGADETVTSGHFRRGAGQRPEGLRILFPVWACEPVRADGQPARVHEHTVRSPRGSPVAPTPAVLGRKNAERKC